MLTVQQGQRSCLMVCSLLLFHLVSPNTWLQLLLARTPRLYDQCLWIVRKEAKRGSQTEPMWKIFWGKKWGQSSNAKQFLKSLDSEIIGPALLVKSPPAEVALQM